MPHLALYGTHRNKLGESPVWDPGSDRLYWVDSVSNTIFSADEQGEGLESWDAATTVGSIALCEDGLLVALDDGFFLLDTDSGDLQEICRPEKGNEEVRFNDGKADRQGRFLAGTMRHSDVDGAPGKLYRLEGRAAREIESGIKLANSLCFSPDGGTMYFADSLQGCIWAYDYKTDGPIAATRRTLIETAPLGSAPDGATVDAEGFLWVAFVQSDEIARISPEGELVERIASPVPYPSCPAFGGANMQTLFVTTLWDTGGMFQTDHEHGGRMLAITGLPCRGIPEAVCPNPLREGTDNES
ncbi:MAG: SMP-30/gluconolactonase/LRE family protein [Erythrobacter sp.]|uniref:SMP-30/gluconolactonase/LRE family protein n=1 Tax=Erythrobacter sp. TaxID=1042 RepID=UPI002620EFD8|nr:SMP-30/gluconolactonase/LRE family protein [Erythrobacter sp.]MDJ0979705.1 SMP-30/gluconolactonase/LRE family protein [Erythrobacter sp.]